MCRTDPANVETAPEAGSRADDLETLIERWWEDHFPGSAVARSTEAWNIAHRAKEALKALLKGI